MGRLLAALVCAIVLSAPAAAMELAAPVQDTTGREVPRPAALTTPPPPRCTDDPAGREQVTAAVAKQRAALVALRVQHTGAGATAIIANADAMLQQIATQAERGLRELGTCAAIAQRATAATETVLELARSGVAQEATKKAARPTARPTPKPTPSPTPRSRRR